MSSHLLKYSQIIKEEADRLGFLMCGISKAGFLEKEAPHLEKWLKKGMHGKMAYMENHFDKRLDPTKLVEGSKSIISLAYNYYTPAVQEDATAPKISKYAYGKDYHDILKKKLAELYFFISENIGNINGRMFVDSAPVMERAWAEKSGLGWIGKNGLLLSKQKGSFFFLAEIILDLELAYDDPMTTDFCGKCTRCIDACPTDAIVNNKIVDGSRCISYLTIELKGELPSEFQNKMDNWMFGCDVCQDVCPWNRFSVQHKEDHFLPHSQLLGMKKTDWEDITKEVFQLIFKESAVKRTKYEGLKRNIRFLNPYLMTVDKPDI